MEEYVTKISLPKLLTRWWLKTRPCKNIVQIGSKGVPACIEFYVPFWAWPFELIHRLFFGRTVLRSCNK